MDSKMFQVNNKYNKEMCRVILVPPVEMLTFETDDEFEPEDNNDTVIPEKDIVSRDNVA